MRLSFAVAARFVTWELSRVTLDPPASQPRPSKAEPTNTISPGKLVVETQLTLFETIGRSSVSQVLSGGDESLGAFLALTGVMGGGGEGTGQRVIRIWGAKPSKPGNVREQRMARDFMKCVKKATGTGVDKVHLTALHGRLRASSLRTNNEQQVRNTGLSHSACGPLLVAAIHGLPTDDTVHVWTAHGRAGQGTGREERVCGHERTR